MNFHKKASTRPEYGGSCGNERRVSRGSVGGGSERCVSELVLGEPVGAEARVELAGKRVRDALEGEPTRGGSGLALGPCERLLGGHVVVACFDHGRTGSGRLLCCLQLGQPLLGQGLPGASEAAYSRVAQACFVALGAGEVVGKVGFDEGLLELCDLFVRGLLPDLGGALDDSGDACALCFGRVVARFHLFSGQRVAVLREGGGTDQGGDEGDDVHGALHGKWPKAG